MAAMPKQGFAARAGYKLPAEPLRGTGWGCAPHTGGHSFMKRVTRKGRHVRFGQIPRSARTCPTGSFGLRRCGNATRCPHASVRYAHPSFIAAFSWRRAQSPAVAVTGQFTPSWLSHGAPFMPPRKRAQGFDVALYRRGAGRLSAAKVGFAASRTSCWHAPPAKKTKRYHWLCCRAAVKANSVGFFPQRGRKLAGVA